MPPSLYPVPVALALLTFLHQRAFRLIKFLLILNQTTLVRVFLIGLPKTIAQFLHPPLTALAVVQLFLIPSHGLSDSSPGNIRKTQLAYI
jgi:hypothetical protein